MDWKKRWAAYFRKIWAVQRAPIYIVLSQTLAMVVNSMGKYLEDEGNGVPPFQVLNVRMVITTVLCAVAIGWHNVEWKESIDDRSAQILLCLRAMSGILGATGFYYSIMYLPLSEAVALNMLAPVLARFTMACLNRAPFRFDSFLWIGASFVGVILSLKPNITLGSDTDNRHKLMGVALACAGAFGTGGSYLTISLIGKQIHPLVVVQVFSLAMAIASALALLYLPNVGLSKNLGLVDWALLIGIGFIGFLMEYLLTLGLALDPGSRATQAIYFQVLLALIPDAVLWHKLPDSLSILGGALVVIASIVMGAREVEAIRYSAVPTMDDIEINSVQSPIVQDDLMSICNLPSNTMSEV